MRIERDVLPNSTIEAFAQQHNLTMRVTERSPSAPCRIPYMARFKDAEIKDGLVLCGMYGNGYSEAEAIHDYARQISGRLLIIDAYGPDRREIRVPKLAFTGR